MFFYLGFLSFDIQESKDSRGSGRPILTILYHFDPLHEHLDISRVIIAESLTLHIACERTRTVYFWFPNANGEPLSCAPFLAYLKNKY